MKDESREALKNFTVEFEKENKLKKCPKCKQIFSATTEFFYRNRTTKDGFDGWSVNSTTQVII